MDYYILNKEHRELHMKNIITAIGFVLLTMSGTSSAVIIGDKDWLQVTATTKYSWNDFDTIFDSTTGACDVVECLLGGAVDLTGYIWANNEDVNGILLSYGLPGLSSVNASNTSLQGVDGLDPLFSIFDPTFNNPATPFNQITGWTRNFDGAAAPFKGDVVSLKRFIEPSDTNDEAQLSEIAATVATPMLGGWVYRTGLVPDSSIITGPVPDSSIITVPVPEPSIVTLFALGLLGLGVARRRKAQS